MKRLIVIITLIALALVACDLPAPTETPTPTPSQDVTVVPLPTDTPIPPTGVTPLPTDTPEPTAEPVYSERLQNGDFEGGFDNAFLNLGIGYGVADNWFPVVWRGFPNPRPCEEGQTEGCNPDPITDRVPEYKPSNAEIGGDPFRVLSGNGQQFFCAGELCYAGVAQTIQTAAGEPCIVSVWGQTWGSLTNRSNVSNEEYRSDYATADDRDNMHLLVVVNPAGDGISFPFPDSYLVEDFGYADGLYDEPDGGAPVGFTFEATGDETTIAFIGYQLFPVGNANWYLDGASVSCAGAAAAPVVDIEQTPTPIATPEISELPEVVTVESQGLESPEDNEENKPMDTDLLLKILFALIAGVVAYPAGGGLGNLVSVVVDIVKAALLLAGVPIGEEWSGRAFSIANLIVFVAVFVITGVNPAEYILPDSAAQIVDLLVNVGLSVVGLLGALQHGDLIHAALKAKAPTLFSATLRAEAAKKS